MQSSSNPTTRTDLSRIRIQQFERYYEQRFGIDKLNIAKVLLANSLFPVMARFGNSVSLTTYLMRYFAMVFNLSCNFVMTYHTGEGKQKMVFKDDEFRSVAAAAFILIKMKLEQQGLLKERAKKLIDFMVPRYIEQHYDIVMKAYKKLDWQGFRTNSISPDNTPTWKPINDLANELDKLRQSGEETLFDQLSTFIEILVRIRVANSHGVRFGKAPTLDTLRQRDIELVDEDDVTLSVVKKSDIKIECSDTDIADENEKRYSRMATKAGKNILRDGDIFYIVGSDDAFNMIGGEFVDLSPISTTNFVLCNSESIVEEMEIPVQGPSQPSSSTTKNDQVSEIEDAQSSANWIKQTMQEHNTETALFGNNEKAKSLYEMISKRKRGTIIAAIQDGKPIEENVKLAKQVVDSLIPTEKRMDEGYEAAAFALVAGRIRSAKNIFRIEGGLLRKV